jgi:hypothetical protein
MAAIAVHIKLPRAGRTVTIHAARSEPVHSILARIAAEGGPEGAGAGEGARLIFAGRALDPALSLGQCQVVADSELHLVARPAVAAVDPYAELRAGLRTAQLRDFEGFEKVGGRDIALSPGGRVGYSQHGVCSYVYKARWRGGRAGGAPLALKVMLNTTDQQQSVAIASEFAAEQELLSDLRRLPAHPNIMTVLRCFTDDAVGLPGWDFERDIVQSRTMMLVMPFVPKDLKNLLSGLRRAGAEVTPARAARIGAQLLRAVAHLEAHDVVHRDVKLDNVLLDNAGDELNERVVLTDFGMCFDCRKNRVDGFRIELRYDGFQRGGAPIAMAPEVSLPRPGPGVYLYYGKNDAWACGIVLHELLTMERVSPFADMEHPATYADAGYRPPSGPTVPPALADTVAGLLRIDPAERLAAAAAAARLEEVGVEIVYQAAEAAYQRQVAEAAAQAEVAARRAAAEAAHAEAARLVEAVAERAAAAQAEAEAAAERARAEAAQLAEAQAVAQVLLRSLSEPVDGSPSPSPSPSPEPEPEPEPESVPAAAVERQGSSGVINQAATYRYNRADTIERIRSSGYNQAVVFEEAGQCHACGAAFTTFKRRHHCRECGRSVCYKHSRMTRPLPHRGAQFGMMPGLKLRVCDGCDERLAAAVVVEVRAAVGLGPGASEQELRVAQAVRAELLRLCGLATGAPPGAVRAALNKPNKYGDLPIDCALSDKTTGLELVRAMVEVGGEAMLGARDLAKGLPLHLAAAVSPFPAVVALLLARGPAVAARVKSDTGRTPLDMAERLNTGPGREEIIALLRAAMR